MAGIDRLRAAVSFFMRGQPEVVDLALTCLLGSGNLLLEDGPGVGKTSLARFLATASGPRPPVGGHGPARARRARARVALNA